MRKLDRLLEDALLAQVSLEEELHGQIKNQLSHLNAGEYPEVNQILMGIKDVLEAHYLRSNAELDRMTTNRQRRLDADRIAANSHFKHSEPVEVDDAQTEIQRIHISQMLRDDYAALNSAAMGNTLLHTTALAASENEIADVALQHLSNTTRLVIQLSDLMPRVIIHELSTQFPEVEPGLGELAAKNTKNAWLCPLRS